MNFTSELFFIRVPLLLGCICFTCRIILDLFKYMGYSLNLEEITLRYQTEKCTQGSRLYLFLLNVSGWTSDVDPRTLASQSLRGTVTVTMLLHVFG